MFYLTVQDVLWINREVLRRDAAFQYARLEEATFYQYAYGDSKELIPQAARFLKGFRRMAPFAEGNDATALVATLAFLRINGMAALLRAEEAAGWLPTADEDALAAICRPDGHDHHDAKPDVRAHIRSVLAQFAPALPELAVEMGDREPRTGRVPVG